MLPQKILKRISLKIGEKIAVYFIFVSLEHSTVIDAYNVCRINNFPKFLKRLSQESNENKT